MGTGTTAEAALELGRNAIGYEINPEYKELIDNKIIRAVEACQQLSFDDSGLYAQADEYNESDE